MRIRLGFRLTLIAVIVGCLAVGTNAAIMKWGAPGAVAKMLSRSGASAGSAALVADGKNLLYAHNILAARAKFLQATTQDPTDQEAQFYYGITRILAVYEQDQGANTPALDSVREILEKAGFVFTAFGLYYTEAASGDSLPPSTPTTQETLDFIRNVLLPEIEGAIANLSNVTNPAFSSLLGATAIDKTGANLSIDYGDAMAMKAAMSAARCGIEYLLAYELNVSPPQVFNGEMHDTMRIRNAFALYPNLLTPKEPERLDTAKQALINAIDALQTAIIFIKARSVKGGHLFVLDVPITNEPFHSTTTDTDRMANFLVDLKASLLTGQKDFTSLSYREPDFRQRTFDASRIFSSANPLNLREKIVDGNGDFFMGDLTFGGAAPLGVGGFREVIPLWQGWNLIALPVIPADMSIPSVLAPIDGKYLVVWGYEPENEWTRYAPGAQDNTLTRFEANRGYWIYMVQAAVLEVRGAHPPRSAALKAGWNLVGLPGFTNGWPANIREREVAAVIGGTAGIRHVWGWNGSWSFYSAGPAQAPIPRLSRFSLPGAYWIRVNRDTNLAPPGFGMAEKPEGYEVWGGSQTGPWNQGDVIANPAAYRYEFIGSAKPSDPDYTAKTFDLNRRFLYYVIRPANPLAVPVKIDGIATGSGGPTVCYDPHAPLHLLFGVQVRDLYLLQRSFFTGLCTDGLYAQIEAGDGGLVGNAQQVDQLTVYGVR